MILYKYYPPTINSFKSIVNAGLWCDQYLNMNDPFDSLAIAKRNFSVEEIQEFRTQAKKSDDPEWNKMAELSDELISEYINGTRSEILSESYFFASLSERKDNILLWSHYGQSHTGFVLEIELDENDHHLQKVSYENSLPSFDTSWFFKFLDEESDDKKNSPMVAYLLKDFAIKSKHWQYEEEWRVCIKNKGYFRYDPSKIKGVYFGMNSDPEVEKIVIFLGSVLTKDVPVYKMQLDPEPLGLIAVDYVGN
ncbi:hypothetical protein FNO01nite_34150 [Flavobacterium noncentrifugens]|uniref:DUF2971 domain-containing protein n=1 Tax=Flavobacterium noncentrifugens TaxID=1128970 RepID=A0A1G8XQ83_9FLAO|nr:DUF2971 domain-containing protein [Flavobacterium noncentrifugens]GEP52743.1 hypothetical protein FNO01nite_34150 [Flavobacterium noncentrifugens]SDJ92822.1 Protein of unknown function [Flavobacterium noncentrifugens]